MERRGLRHHFGMLQADPNTERAAWTKMIREALQHYIQKNNEKNMNAHCDAMVSPGKSAIEMVPVNHG